MTLSVPGVRRISKPPTLPTSKGGAPRTSNRLQANCGKLLRCVQRLRGEFNSGSDQEGRATRPQNWSLGQSNFASRCAMLRMGNSQMTRATRPVGDLLHSGGQLASPLKSAGSEQKASLNCRSEKHRIPSDHREPKELSSGLNATPRTQRWEQGEEKALAAVAANRNTCQFRNRHNPLTNLEHSVF